MTTRDHQDRARQERIHTADSMAAEISERLLAEGVKPVVEAARAVGVPASKWALHRVSMSGALETLKIAGQRYTSEAAMRRWVNAASALPDRQPRQARARRGKRARPVTSAAARSILARCGLPTGGGRDA